ncbi:MAG: IS3 family transposase, partial [Gammaproteobacteria bacterium]
HGENFVTRQQAKSEIFQYIKGFYNKNRLHSTLGYCSPDEFEQQCFLVEVA